MGWSGSCFLLCAVARHCFVASHHVLFLSFYYVVGFLNSLSSRAVLQRKMFKTIICPEPAEPLFYSVVCVTSLTQHRSYIRYYILSWASSPAVSLKLGLRSQRSVNSRLFLWDFRQVIAAGWVSATACRRKATPLIISWWECKLSGSLFICILPSTMLADGALKHCYDRNNDHGNNSKNVTTRKDDPALFCISDLLPQKRDNKLPVVPNRGQTLRKAKWKPCSGGLQNQWLCERKGPQREYSPQITQVKSQHLMSFLKAVGNTRGRFVWERVCKAIFLMLPSIPAGTLIFCSLHSVVHGSLRACLRGHSGKLIQITWKYEFKID